jgi:hypothetical protein
MNNQWGMFLKLLSICVAMLGLFWTIFINPMSSDLKEKATIDEVEKMLSREVFNVVVQNINDDIIEIKIVQKEIKVDMASMLVEMNKINGRDR